jgi:peptidyl-prolyl cis-trans isomerase C
VIKKYLVITFVLAPIALYHGCSKPDPSPVIAQVGNVKFTVEDLLRNIPAEYRDHITNEQNINYVKQWMDTELLFQDALRKKIDKEPEIRNRMKKMQKDLLAAEIINRLSIENEKSVIDNNAIHEYYNQHHKNFIREVDKLKFYEIVVDDLKTAWFINKTLTSQNYEELALQYSKLSSPGNPNNTYTALNEIPVEIQKEISNYSLEVNTVPIKTELGYHVIRVIDRLKKDDVCTEDEVREEIINILTNRSQKDKMDKLLSDLRLKTNIQLNLDLISGVLSDSVSQKP